jgi:hypothetical protein
MAVAGDLMFLKRQDGRFSVAIACTELADTTDTANVIIRPPNAWAVAVLAGLAINWLMPLPFVPAAVSAGWLGAIVFALALALVAWAIAIITRAGSNVPTNLPTTTLLVSCCTIAPRLAQNEERECAGREAGNRRGLGQGEMAINYRSHFACRIDACDADGGKVIEHLAGVEDLQVAKATDLAACQRWPGTPITLRQGRRVIEDSRRTRLV